MRAWRVTVNLSFTLFFTILHLAANCKLGFPSLYMYCCDGTDHLGPSLLLLFLVYPLWPRNGGALEREAAVDKAPTQAASRPRWVGLLYGAFDLLWIILWGSKRAYSLCVLCRVLQISESSLYNLPTCIHFSNLIQNKFLLVCRKNSIPLHGKSILNQVMQPSIYADR